MVELDPEKVNGEPVFKGTRLPAQTIADNIDAYLDEGLFLDQAIADTTDQLAIIQVGWLILHSRPVPPTRSIAQKPSVRLDLPKHLTDSTDRSIMNVTVAPKNNSGLAQAQAWG